MKKCFALQAAKFSISNVDYNSQVQSANREQMTTINLFSFKFWDHTDIPLLFHIRNMTYMIAPQGSTTILKHIYAITIQETIRERELCKFLNVLMD